MWKRDNEKYGVQKEEKEEKEDEKKEKQMRSRSSGLKEGGEEGEMDLDWGKLYGEGRQTLCINISRSTCSSFSSVRGAAYTMAHTASLMLGSGSPLVDKSRRLKRACSISLYNCVR